jgi:hypothetical protein
VARILELHIEELTLAGYSRRDGLRIGDALQAELERMLATQVLPAFGGVDAAIPRIDAGAFKMVPGARAEATGAQIAQRVLGGLAQGALDRGPGKTRSAER